MPQSIKRSSGHEHHRNGRAVTLALQGRYVLVLKYLSDQVSWSDGLKQQIHEIMRTKPNCVTFEKMGFIPDWDNDPLWSKAVNQPPQL